MWLPRRMWMHKQAVAVMSAIPVGAFQVLPTKVPPAGGATATAATATAIFVRRALVATTDGVTATLLVRRLYVASS